MDSGPDYFTERVRVRCERDMEAGILVTDLKQAGIFETIGTNGEVFYREGHPYKAGSSGPVHAAGTFSTCDMLFTVKMTPTNTIWHSWISATATNVFGHNRDSGGVDTALPTSMAVTGVQTNWPGSYERGSDIPLANLGDYKILLSVK
jgi:hypothetical protein